MLEPLLRSRQVASDSLLTRRQGPDQILGRLVSGAEGHDPPPGRPRPARADGRGGPIRLGAARICRCPSRRPPPRPARPAGSAAVRLPRPRARRRCRHPAPRNAPARGRDWRTGRRPGPPCPPRALGRTHSSRNAHVQSVSSRPRSSASSGLLPCGQAPVKATAAGRAPLGVQRVGRRDHRRQVAVLGVEQLLGQPTEAAPPGRRSPLHTCRNAICSVLSPHHSPSSPAVTSAFPPAASHSSSPSPRPWAIRCRISNCACLAELTAAPAGWFRRTV